MPHPGRSWQPHGRPATQPHEYIRGGTCKLLTLFHPATGQVHIQPVSRCTNQVLHGWLKESLTAIVAALPAPTQAVNVAALRAAWQTWQNGLAERFTLPEHLPPLRLLLVWDNLTGHKSAEMVVWLCQHGIMPLYTPLGGSWLNMANGSSASSSAVRWKSSIHTVLPRSAPGSSRPRGPGTNSPRPSPGTAGVGNVGAIAAPTDIQSAAPPLVASISYPALNPMDRNGRVQGS